MSVCVVCTLCSGKDLLRLLIQPVCVHGGPTYPLHPQSQRRMSPAFHVVGEEKVIKGGGRDAASTSILKTKTNYALHLVTFCLVVMEATRAGSEDLVGTVNENLALLLFLSFLHCSTVHRSLLFDAETWLRIIFSSFGRRDESISVRSGRLPVLA